MKTNLNKLESELKEVYKQKGLRGIYYFLNKKGVKFEKYVHEFGLKGNKKAQEEKEEFLKDAFCYHYYNRGITSRKNGYSYNVLRGIYIKILNN